MSCKVQLPLNGNLYGLWLITQDYPCVVLEGGRSFVKLQDIMTLYMVSFTYYQFKFCTAFMPNGDSYGFQLKAISQAHPWSNVAQGGIPLVLRRWGGNVPEIHLDRRLCRMSYTTLKHSIARAPHSGHAAMSLLSFRLGLRDLRHAVAARALTLMALGLPRRPLASESLSIEDKNIEVR